MKKGILLCVGLIITFSLFSQSPQFFSYQAVLRNLDGTIKANESVSVMIEILQGSIDGSTEYLEIHNETTTSLGLIVLKIGSGTTSDDLSIVDWSIGPYFMKVTVDGVILGTSQLLSVPYALHSRTAEIFTGEISVNESDPEFNAWDKSIGITITESQISDLQSYLIEEIDPVFTSWDKSDGIVITESQITDLKAYLTTETDPLFNGWDKRTGISINESQISDLQQYVTEELDPAFTNWDKSDGIVITESQIIDLKAYLIAEADPEFSSWNRSSGISITEGQISDLQEYATRDMAMQNITNIADPVSAQDAATKAYVDNIKETIYNELLSIGLNGVVTDIDGNTYKTIKIGDQVWMAENLRTTQYPDGRAIPLVENTDDWRALGGEDEGMCYYNNSSINADIYGALYTWPAAMNASGGSASIPGGIQGICPDGWHLPSDAEWKELEMTLGMPQVEADKQGARGTNEGSKLAGDETLWTIGDLLSDPEFGSSGFNALPAGFRETDGTFVGLGEYTYWYLATVGDPEFYVWYRSLEYHSSEVIRFAYLTAQGFSVRCLKD